MEKRQCLILAGGLATRMRPITESIPKALIPAGDQPFAYYQLMWLASSGVTDIVYSVGYRSEMIREFVGDGKNWGLRVRYVDEGKELRGTGGALRAALDEGVLDPCFLVVYGDSFLPIDIQPVWKQFQTSKTLALMTVLRNEGRWDQSNAVFDGSMITLYDKVVRPKPTGMQYIDYGLSAIRRDVVAREIPAFGKFDLAEFFRVLSIRNELAGFEVSERFYEIGSPEGLEAFKDYVACGEFARGIKVKFARSTFRT